jgi:hypothetical protein
MAAHQAACDNTAKVAGFPGGSSESRKCLWQGQCCSAIPLKASSAH